MALSALSEDGLARDWWFIYKVPQLNAGAGNDQATGFEYVYYDPILDKVEKSAYLLNGGQGALNKTLDSILNEESAATGYILYNDERPDDDVTPDDANLGHTKGVLAFDLDSNTAFWLLHSWPKFAGGKDEPAAQYGQTYLCLTMDVQSAAKIARLMTDHHEPQVYKSRLPASGTVPNEFNQLCGKINPNSMAAADSLDLVTLGGMPFKVIAKNRRWNKDFWNELVGPTLGENIDVETWIRGPIPPMADTDGIHKTFDIKYINLGPLGAHWAWPETHDHAKWAISEKNNWICVGDINRMISQRKRGGGTAAFQNDVLWTALSKTSLLLAPPGHSRTGAHELINTTHLPK